MHPIRNLFVPLCLVACLTLQFAAPHSLWGQSDLSFEPYSVYVAHEEAYARCGPSGEYYRTDPLRHGQELEVYAETDDGWLGIRPPQDSFCWVPAETIELNETDQSGTVIEDRTVAWIGTHLGRARRYRWQIQLAKGEQVSVLGRSEREGPDGPQLWYRIVPPSGEYRWVHRDQIVTSSEQLVATIRRPSPVDSQPTVAPRPARPDADQPAIQASARRKSRPSARPSSGDTEVATSSGPSILQPRPSERPASSWNATDAPTTAAPIDSVAGTEHENRGSVGTQPTPVQPPAVATAHQPSNAMQQPNGSLASVEFLSRPRLLEIGGAPAAPRDQETASDANWVSGVARRTSNASLTPVVSAATSTTAQPASVMQVSTQQPISNQKTVVVSAGRIAQIESETRGADLERLSLIFSRLMATRATAAEAEPVARAARMIASSTSDVVTAGRARELAERAERYQRVASQRDGQNVIQNTIVQAAHTASLPLGQAPVIAAEPNTHAAETASQTGYLVQVYSARPHSPPFALTDNTGRTVAYVTPSPGVNLRTHLNSRITVVGNSGFLTGLNTPHILATDAKRASP